MAVRIVVGIVLPLAMLVVVHAAEIAAMESDHLASSRPHIIVVVADDLGWGHVGWQNPQVRTPHLDRLANGGIKLNRHYVAPVCSPTRVAFMTGRYWSRFGVNGPLPSEPDSPARAMPPGTATIASSLRAAGYRTALVGKWHLGARLEDGPENFGFDFFYGLRVGGMTPLTHRWLGLGESVLWRNDRVVEEQGHATDLFAREAIRWIEASDQRPFFLYLAFTSPHVPLQEPQRWMSLYEGIAPDLSHQLYWAAISHLDDAVGQVLAAVERAGQRDNTLLLFLSDNGAPGQPNRMQVRANHEAYLDVTLPGDNRPFRGKKGTLYEGGIRTPAFLWWPARLPPGVCDEPLHVTDWMPTLCALVGQRVRPDLNWDGRDAWPMIRGEADGSTPRVLYTKGGSGSEAAVHRGDWKLVRLRSGDQLFHLADDGAETKNRAADRSELVQQLGTLLETEAAADNDARPEASGPEASGPEASGGRQPDR